MIKLLDVKGGMPIFIKPTDITFVFKDYLRDENHGTSTLQTRVVLPERNIFVRETPEEVCRLICGHLKISTYVTVIQNKGFLAVEDLEVIKGDN